MPRTRRKRTRAHTSEPYPTAPEATGSQQRRARIRKVILRVPQPNTSTPDAMDKLPPPASPPSSPPGVHHAPQYPLPPLPPPHVPHVPAMAMGHPVTIGGQQNTARQHTNAPPVLRYCRNVRPTWVKFNSKDTKESEWCSRF